MDNIAEYLKAKNYFVQLSVTDNSLIAKFPKKIIGDLSLSSYDTTYERKKTYISISGDGFSTRITCPKYSTKILIRSDIILRCQIIGFSEDLIIRDFQEKINEIISLTENEIDKENKLIISLSQGINASMVGGELVAAARQLASDNEVLEGYDAFFKFAENGLNYDKKLRKELVL